MNSTSKKKEKLVVISAKVPASIAKQIKDRAQSEDRTPSKIVSRLLSTHPELVSQPIALNQ